MKKEILFILALLLVLFYPYNFTQAGFGISPPYIKGEVVPGGVIEGKITVLRSVADEETLFKYTAHSDDGIEDWIRVVEGDTTFAVGELSREITVEIKIPKDAEYGDYSGAILLQIENERLSARITVDFAVIKKDTLGDVIVVFDNKMFQRLKGKILLQVEQNGEAWYVSPSLGKRIFLGRPDDAFNVMREQGVGIRNKDLYKISVGVPVGSMEDSDGDGLSDNLENAIGLDVDNKDTDGDGYIDGDELKNGYNPWGTGLQNIDKVFAKNQSGKIFLQIEKKGEAWYVNPSDNKRYFLGKPTDAFNVMRSLGLGISNNDLEQILERQGDDQVQDISLEEASAIASDFINNKLMLSNDLALIAGVVEESLLYKVSVDVPSSDDNIISYLTKDGKIFFPAAIETNYQNDSGKQFSNLDEAKVFVVDFIEDNLLAEGQIVPFEEIVEKTNFYEVVIDLSGSYETKTSYLTKDGKIFLPEGYNIAEYNQGVANVQIQPKIEEIVKSEVSKVELFVMSHCPYGTQIEKGILPVLEILGDKVDFELKFCDYAMHGEKEIYEQLNQYCIQKEQGTKLLSYLTCFLKEGDGEGCLTEVNVDLAVLEACASKTDEEFNISNNYADESTWKGAYPLFNIYKEDASKYMVSGSPSLVVNGSKVVSGRDSNSLLDTICLGYENPPAECEVQLGNLSPAPGFGFDGSGTNTNAGCGT